MGFENGYAASVADQQELLALGKIGEATKLYRIRWGAFEWVSGQKCAGGACSAMAHFARCLGYLGSPSQ